MPSTTPLAPKTPSHTRRRRRVQVTSDAKENQGSAYSSNLSKTKTLDDDFGSFDNGDSSITNSNSCSDDISSEAAAMRQFQNSLDNTASATLWKDHIGLAECVVRASLLSKKNCGALCLEEHASALLSSSRKLIKAASVSQDTTQKLDNLLVAVHVLRALGPVVESSVERLETCIRLFYHLITVATELHLKGGNSRAGLVTLAGYEALGERMMYRYACSTHKRVVGFELVQAEDHDIHWFVKPTWKSKNRPSSPGTMTLHQVSSIALKTTTCVANVLIQFGSGKNNKHPEQERLLRESAPLYGELARHIVGNVKRKRSPHHSTIHLFQHVYMPWLSFLAQTSDEECNKDLSTQCKAAHRILWDAAAKLKSAGSSYEPQQLEQYCLELRKHSILMLLPTTSSSNVFVVETHMENACNYAWKAANVFAQQTSISSFPAPSENPLTKFYFDIGSVLDNAITPGTSLPLYYVEYCAHRSLHVGSGVSVADLLSSPSLIEGKLEKEARIGHILAAITLLGVRVKQNLESEYCSVSVDRDDAIGNLERAVELFERCVILEISNLSREIQTRCFRLLSMLSLHRTVFVAIKDEKSWEAKCADLHVASTILFKCLGPFTFALIKEGGMDASKAPQFCDTVVECFIRPLSAFEKLRDHHQIMNDAESSDYFMKMRDGVAHDMCHVIKGSDNIMARLSPTSIEKCAKSLSSIARQRTDRSTKAEFVFPLLCSLILYQYISEHQSISGDDVVDYQLPARFADLASILQSIGMVDEACLVLSLVIVTEMPRCYSLQHSGTWSELDCLNFFAARSKNVILPVASQPEATKLAKSSIRRLVNIFGDSEKQTNNTGTVRFERRAPKELQISSALYLLKESICSGLPIVDLFAKACGIEFHLGQLLGAVFQGSQSLAESPGKKLNSSFSKPAMLLADVLVEFGTMIKKVVRKEDPDEDDSILNDLLQQYQVLVVQINDLVPDFVSDPVFPSSNSTILGMFKMVASTSVLPCQNFYDEFMQKLKVEFSECGTHRIARELAEESLQNFETANSGIMSGAWVSISTSLRASVYQYCRILQSWRLPEASMVTNDLKLLYLCRHSAEIAEQTTGNTTGLDRFLKQSIIWTLIHFQNILECRGDSLQATVVALWALSLENESDADENDWLRSITMSSWINGGSLTRALDLSVEESSTNLPSLSPNSIAWIAIYERLLNEIRLDLSRSNCILGNYCYPYEKLVKIKSEVSNIDSGKSETIFLLSQWLLSTIELTHSEIAASAGLFSQALKHSQQCIRHCQTLMKSTFLFEPDAPFWVLAACSTLFGRARQRYTESLGRKSKIYYLIGDYRKATAAIETFAGFLGIDVSTREKDRRNKLQHLISSFTTGASAHQRKYLRLNVKQQCFSSAYDLVARNFSSSTLEGLSEKLFHGPQEVLCTPPEIETLQDLLSVGDILYGDSGVLCSQSRFSDFYNKAMSLDTGRMQLNLQLPEKLPGDMKCKEATLFFSQLKLRQARCLLQSMTVRVVNENSENLIKSLCEDVAGSALSSSTDRVWAYFHLGTLRLIEARRSGALLRLWQENSATEATDDYSLRGAKSNFLDAARFNTMGSNILSRNILRNLALVSGPEHCKISGLSAGILVLASIGRSSREFTLRSLNETIGTMAETSTKDVREAFTSFDADFSDLHRRDRMVVDFLERFAKVSPKKWKFAAPVICSSGEVLLTSIEKSSPDGNFKMRTSCLFPDGCTKNAYDDIMKPLDEIIGRSQKQLHGMDHATVTEHFSKESAKRKWWDNRNQLDTELRNLVERVESKYFPTLHLRTSSTEIGGSAHHSIFEDDDSAGFPCGNLASKFEAACEPSDDSESPDESYTEESLNKLTVPKLKARLLNYGLSETQTRKLRKYELIDMLIKEQRNERDKLNDSPSTSDSVKGCLFLILDENLHRFPFEGMPSLVNRAVCRVPSLQLVFATLLERRSHTPLVDPFNISYVLDPENNLPETRRRLLPELESLSSNQNWEWNGTVGKIPSGEVFETCLEKDNGMMMYFGHGGAKCCFSRRQVDGMACKKRGSTSKIDSPAVRSCKSSVILMGCSSGRLISVNRKDSDSLEQIPLHYEPEGIALSYLCAGAPCVVGNIWDVTDHDIDRFFGDSYEHDSDSVAGCISIARSACKLRYIVGCAPVCYGVPVYLSTEVSR